ncbi:endo/exonuclease/phosphatase family protein [Escherichia coli]|nr:endo/exonuclease/phosphatase family protein [Escherichia coli]
MNALYRFAREMSLRQVRFNDAQRRRAVGRPLDFVLCLGLNVSEASVLVSRACCYQLLTVDSTSGPVVKRVIFTIS